MHTPYIMMIYTDNGIDLIQFRHLQVDFLSLHWSEYIPLKVTEARINNLDQCYTYS